MKTSEAANGKRPARKVRTTAQGLENRHFRSYCLSRWVIRTFRAYLHFLIPVTGVHWRGMRAHQSRPNSLPTSASRTTVAVVTLVASLGMLFAACDPLAYSALTLPTWSADDSQLMYLDIRYSPPMVASKSELRLWTESTGDVSRILTVSGRIHSYSWASSRGLVAYSTLSNSKEGTSTYHVRVVRIADLTEVARWEREQGNPSGSMEVSWSPNEEWLAIAAFGQAIQIARFDELPRSREIAVLGGASGVSWNEESTKLGYVSSGTIYMADTRSLEVTEVPGPRNAIGPVMGPQFRPGTSQMLTTASHILNPGDNTTRVVVNDVRANETTIVVERRGPIPKASWSYNGELIAFTAYDGLGCPESGTNESQRDSSPRSSLGISRVLGLSRGHGPTTCILEGNAMRALIGDPDGHADDIAWAHRSDQIAYSGRPDRQSEKGIYTVDADSRTSRRVA